MSGVIQFGVANGRDQTVNAANPLPVSSSVGGAAVSTSNPFPVKSASYSPLGYQQILSATLASSTAMTVPSGATTAIVQNNGTTAARFRYDGATTAPTASTGQRLAAGAVITMDIGNAGLTSTRFIYEASGPILDITYFS